MATLLFGTGGACVDLTRPPDVSGFDGSMGGQGGGGSGGDSDAWQPDSAEETGGSGGPGGVLGMGGITGAGGITGGGDAMVMPDSPLDLSLDLSLDLVPDRPPATLALGAACSTGSQCMSTHCVDGVCCDSDCTGICRTCGAGGGVCRSAAAGTDPRDSCPDDGATTCGRTGMCDGNAACQKYAANTICSPLSCADGQISISRCDGAGTCKATRDDCAPYGCTSTGTCRTTCTTKADCASPADCFSGICGGIVGTYFDSTDFTGRSITRTDREVNFDWLLNSPAPTMPTDQFSIRWTATLTPRFTENTTFYVVSDDGVRLWVDGQLIIDDFRSHGSVQVSGSINLRANKKVSIKLEYFDDFSEAAVALSWSSASLPRQIIPVSVLTP
jgi:hypothetical protein